MRCSICGMSNPSMLYPVMTSGSYSSMNFEKSSNILLSSPKNLFEVTSPPSFA